MAIVHLDNDLYRQLQSRAEAQGSSVDATVQRILEEHTSAERVEAERRWRALDRLVARVQASPWALPEEDVNGAELIRQMREEEEAHLERLIRGDA